MRVLLITTLVAFGIVAWGSAPARATEEASPSKPDSVMMDIGEVLDELLWPEPYLYQSAGSRDPFESLLDVVDSEGQKGLLGVNELIVVGILWGERDRFALVETPRGQNLILRKGDAIRNGRILAVLPDGLKVRYSHYGVVKTMTLPVVSGEEGKDER